MKWMVRVSLVVVPIASIGCAASSYLRGRVTDCRDSAPLDGADVQLTTQVADVEWSAQQTGSDGVYAFKVNAENVMPVRLVAAKKGYQTVEKTYSSAPAGLADVCMRPTIR